MKISARQHLHWMPAPWGTPLKIMSMLATAVLLAAAIFTAVEPLPNPQAWLLPLLPLFILLLGILFMVRGYAVHDGCLQIRRLLWTTRLSLAGLATADVLPNATQSSLRLFGNGGLFVFAGCFRNTRLGTYRAWVTDGQRTLVLRFPKRCWVISPADPIAFASELRSITKAPSKAAP